MKVYLTDKNCLAYFEQKASKEYWDSHWAKLDLGNYVKSCTNDGIFVDSVKKHLPKNSILLEGGSGMGNVMNALIYNGYRAVGVDYAKKTVEMLNKEIPEFDVRVGDVRKLEIEDNNFDGYISGGVIEHFWEGYQDIISEMYRVLKPGGKLFVTFPYMSPIRRLKAKLGRYPKTTMNEMNLSDDFYQFGLDSNHVIKDLENLGFKLIEKSPKDGLKGFKDEVTVFKKFLQPIYDGNKYQFSRKWLDFIFRPFASHVVLLVLEK